MEYHLEHEEGKSNCLTMDYGWAGFLIVDLFSIVHIIIKFRTAYVNPNSRVFGRGDLVADPTLIALRYLKGNFAIDLAPTLPLPQYHEIWVYKFNRSSNILNKICSTKFISPTCFESLNDYGTLVQGVVYWPIEICFPVDEFDPRFQILAYHLSKNKHWMISPPVQCYFGLGLCVDGCNLIATSKRGGDCVVEVWIMKEDCWTKYANIGGSHSFFRTSPLGFFPNGDLIVYVGRSRLMRCSFNHDEVTLLMEYGYKGDGVIMCADTLVSPSC